MYKRIKIDKADKQKSSIKIYQSEFIPSYNKNIFL